MDLVATLARRIARARLAAGENPLDGKRRPQAVRYVNWLLERAPTKGLHRDQYWRPIQAIWKLFNDNDLDFGITKAEYEQDKGVPVRKVWLAEVQFRNERGVPGVVYVRVVASGAGSVAEPLDVYDVVAYAS